MQRNIRTVLTLAVMISCAAAIEAQPYKIVDTGQKKCYDNASEIGAPQPGQPFYGQDAQHPRNEPKYTVSGDGKSVYDHNTGLTWQRSPDTNGDGAITFADKLTWAQAQSRPAELNAAAYGGFTDWRLPSIKELYSLMNFSGTDPSGFNGTDTKQLTPFIDTNYFLFAYGDTGAGERIIDSQYGSSTMYVNKTVQGWDKLFGLNLADGRIKGYDLFMPGNREKTFCIQCVRGNPDYGKNDFADNGDSTVTDRATGLMWSRADCGAKMNWQEALAWVQTKNAQNYLGHGDWRMPNAKELQSIVDYSRSPDNMQSAAIDPLFLCTPIVNEANQPDFPCYWSSTTHAAFNGMGAAAVYVAFGRAMGYMGGMWLDVHGAGCQRSDPKNGNPADFPFGRGPQGDAIRIYNFVRLVRDAQAATGIRGETGAGASTFALEQCYPNPIVTTGTIRFSLPSCQHAALRLSDAMGRMVRVLFEGETRPGVKEMIFLPEILPNGVYHLVLETGRQIAHRAFIVSR